jgi:hypothetical protein
MAVGINTSIVVFFYVTPGGFVDTHQLLTVKTEMADSSESSVPFYQSIRRHFQDDHILNTCEDDKRACN